MFTTVCVRVCATLLHSHLQLARKEKFLEFSEVFCEEMSSMAGLLLPVRWVAGKDHELQREK